MEACTIECKGCHGVRRAWFILDSGDAHVVRTSKNAIQFTCPQAMANITVVVEVEDDNLNLSYRAAEMLVDDKPSTISLKDISDSPPSSFTPKTKSLLPSVWGPRLVDPFAQVGAKATKCRRKHKEIDGPKITITFWISTDGVVHDAQAAVSSELGECLTQAVAHTRFEPKLVLKKTLEL